MPTIPPLVCNTPPPIDDLESDDDLSAPNDCNDHFDDESLPASPQQQQQQQQQQPQHQNPADTILVRNSLSPSPEMTVAHTQPTIATTTTESPISLELELESQIVNDGLDTQLTVVVADDELQFDGDKIRAGSDSAIGDVYSNGQCSNSSIVTSKETDTSNSSVDLKRSEILPDNEYQISVHTTDFDDDDDGVGDNDDADHRNEYNCEHALPAIEQSDNLSSSPSWNNLDGQTPEPEFNSFSMPAELNSIEQHSSISMIVNTDNSTLGFVDDCQQQSNSELSLTNTNASCANETIANDSISKVNNADDNSFSESGEIEMGAIKFCADFGQFATFDDEQFNTNAHEASPTAAAAAEEAATASATTTIEPINKCDRIQAAFNDDNSENNGEGGQTNDDDFNDDDDDDEFGEFNDFQQMPVVQTTTSASVAAPDTVIHRDVTPSNASVLLDSENIKQNLSSILDTIFPADKQNCDATTTTTTTTTASDSDYSYEKQQFINNLTIQLRNVENSNALKHQWAKSTSKTLLVKALGIDSRNILYGEKWNSSAPKFAANLGLSPLEPMKVTTLSPTSTSTLSSSAVAMSTNVENDLKGHKSILEVPAAQFDWNSSGLINPLDALHAHTLLLDLEQLVVVANLDKINLNSSSSACSTTNLAQNLQSSISKSTTTATVLTTTPLSSSTFTSQPYQIVSALPLNESKLAKTSKQRSTTTTTPTSLDNLNQINKTNFIKCTNGIHTMRYDTNNVKPLVTGNPFDSYFRAQNSTNEDQLPLDHQKVIQRVQSSKSLASADLLPPQLLSSSIAPQPLSVPIMDTVSMVRSTKQHQPLDDVHSDEIASETTSPTSDSYSYAVPGSSGTMKETHIFTPITPKSSVVNSVETSSTGTAIPSAAATATATAGITVTTNPIEPIVPSLIPNGISNQTTCDDDPFQSDTIVIKENVVKKEYRDVEYEPNKLMAANACVDDFTEFQFAQPTQSMPNSNAIIEQNLNTTNIPLNIQSTSMNFLPDIYDKSSHKSMPNDRNVNNFDSLSSISAPTIDRISADTSTMPSINTGNQSEFDIYSSVSKSSFPSLSHNKIGNASNVPPTEQFGCTTTDPMEIFSIQSTQQQHYHSHSAFEQSQSTVKLDTQQPVTKQNNNNNNNSIALTNNNNNTISNSINSVNSNNLNTTTTSYMRGGSNILMPQMANNVQSKQTNVINNALTIQWPEPGINTDQLEQLEARFSIQPDSNIKSDIKTKATKHNDQASSSTATATTTTPAAADDEWSDFVSVIQPQTPITNILNKNLLKQQNNDEDDWSEFVSSTPPPPNSLHQFAPPPQNSLLGINVANNTTAAAATANNHTNYNNVFKPWTTTQFPHQKIHASSYHQSDGYGKSSKYVNSISNGDSSHVFQNVMPKSQSVAAPSIISLPDLGFVAPKSLVNMPNRTLAKK